MLESRSICQSGQPRWAKISRPHSKATCPATILAIADDANALSFRSLVWLLMVSASLVGGIEMDGLDGLRRAQSLVP